VSNKEVALRELTNYKNAVLKKCLTVVRVESCGEAINALENQQYLINCNKC